MALLYTLKYRMSYHHMQQNIKINTSHFVFLAMSCNKRDSINICDTIAAAVVGDFYIRQVNKVKLAEIMFSLRFLLSVCEQSINRLWHHRCMASVNLFARYICFNRNVFNSCVKS